MERLSEHMDGDGAAMYRHACALGLEGIVSKRRDAPYRSGRSPHWVKVKNPDAPAVRRTEEATWQMTRRLLDQLLQPDRQSRGAPRYLRRRGDRPPISGKRD